MFTGIVEEIGTLSRMWRVGQGYHMAIRAKTVLDDTRLGDSIAVNGVCLTVTHLNADSFTVGLSPETRARTNLVHLREGQAVNLERALTPSTRMGGHFVQGHVDGVGVVSGLRPDGDALWLTIGCEAEVMRYIVPKGFIALDGVSLTVVDALEGSFTVTLIAFTQQHITLARQQAGYKVNIEVDILGKYVERMLAGRSGRQGGVSMDFLAEHGYG